MNGWTALTMFAAALVLVRAANFANAIDMRAVPQHVALAVVALGAGAFLYLLAPVWGEVYTWRDTLFAAAVAVYVWLDRRAPLRYGRAT